MAKEAYYFSHDSNARNDTKILSMRCDYGLEGYAMYFIIIECMREEENYKLKLEDNTYRALAMQMHCKIDTVEKFINDCINTYHLFQCDEHSFWSDSLLKRMGKMNDIRKKRKLAAAKRWDSSPYAMQEDSKCNANAEQNHPKEKKRKENKDIYSGRRDVFEHYLSLNLIKHKKYTPAMDMAIKTAMKNNGYTIDDCKALLDRHKQTVEATKDSQYPVRVRPLHEFFGQKAYQAKHLICAEYEEGGKYYNVTPKREEPQPSYFKPLAYEYED